MSTNVNYEELKVVELKELCRKAGIKGYSRMKKQELVDALNNSKELKKLVLSEAKAFAKEELGRDMGRAVSFWKQLKDIKMMSPNDYYDVVENWKVLLSLLYIAEDTNASNRTVTDSLMGTAEMLRDIFSPTTDISQYSDDALKDFINSCLELFSLSAFSKRLKKESTEIIKMSMEDIEFDNSGIAWFDSSKASKFTGKEVKLHKGDMRIVESAEDGISRMLSNHGLSSITVFMGMTSNDETKMNLINASKANIFTNGFFDKATGKHYMFAFQNPSSCRKANFMFVEAKDWNDVCNLWYEITGLKDMAGFRKAFLDKDGKVVMAKLLARISTRGSNSFNLSKIAPKWSDKIAKANIKYFKDPEVQITRDFKTMKGPGCMEMQTGVARTVTPGDGQMIGSFEFHALMAVALRIISENEYNEFIILWDKAKKNVQNVKEGSRLYKLIKKIPGVFQIRHGEKKGICVRYNIEAVNCLKGVQALVPDSVRKFVAGDWDEFPLEICNYIKKKDGWVALNPQFIGALEYENPNALIPIVEYWFKYMEESLTDVAKAQQFHNIIKSSDDDDNRTVASNLVAAMRTSSDLIDDAQICNWRKDQYTKFINDMKIGRILVPGQYTYEICDPAMIINAVYGTDMPHLAEGEFYHNGKTCKCGLFRSPLIHPFEAQRVQLSNNEAYWYMSDVIVFNGFDGLWDKMGGSDFDGDTCAVITDDTEFGKLIVDGIRDIPFDIWEEAQKAIKKEFKLSNFVDHLVTSAKVDRTGVITNYASKALDISNHLKSAVYFAKLLKCENITLIHPRSFGENGKYGVYGDKYQPVVDIIDGVRTYCMKGFVEAISSYTNGVQSITFADTGYVGVYSFESILDIANSYLDIVEILRILQGREIDGAKTGVYAEGINGDEFIDAVKIRFTPHHIITRQETLGKDVSASSVVNRYWSLAPLGRINDYVNYKENSILDFLNNGSHKLFLLQSLLTQEEANAMNTAYRMQDGSCKTIVDVMNLRKKEHNTKVYNIMKNLSGDDASVALKSVKDAEIEELHNLAVAFGVSIEVIAVASYIATYTKDSKQSEGLTYAWLLFDELLSVFSRGNKKFELFKLPMAVEIKNVSIVNNAMYINGNKHISIDADDCDNVVIQTINGRPYALVHKNSKNIVTPRSNNVVFGSKAYTIGTLGFKYHIAGDAPKEEWKRLVKENGFVFDIVMDATNRAVLSINGKSISALMSVGADFDLMNKKVKVINNAQTNPIKENTASITNIQVIIIGEA